MARSRLLAALALVSIPVAGSAQNSDIVLTGTALCEQRKAATVYEPRRQFEGIMFSFIDGVSFTPCPATKRCDTVGDPRTMDLETTEGAWGRHQGVWTGWGYYRVRFTGRIGRRGPCALDGGDFYEVIKVHQARRLPDSRYDR